MSGHSKWSTIKRKKEKTDGARAKIFTKIGREISVAVKEGGTDPAVNFKLAAAIAKAKQNNVPNDNIERLINKNSDTKSYDEITYEGYGPAGVAIMVEALTDNRNRTAADVRHYFDKFGGNMGTSGCVSFIFAKKGVIIIESVGLSEDEVMENSIEAGAADFFSEDDIFVIHTDVKSFDEVLSVLSEKYDIASSGIEFVPDNYVEISNETHDKNFNLLIEHLEDCDDVVEIWHNRD